MRYVKKTTQEGLMSIGDVARATGISVYKLRIWERRYGFPEPLKLPSGHRRYTSHTVDHLKLVNIALKNGTRASKVAKMSIAELIELVKGSNHQESIEDFEFQKIVSKLKTWDENSIWEIFERDWNKEGPIGFINNSATKLIRKVGLEWQNGNMTIAEEHFISEILNKFLLGKWSNTNAKLAGKSILLTTLEEESHSFGLHFCAITANQAKVKVLNLGPSLPVEEIARAANKELTGAICISISSYYPNTNAVPLLKQLRQLVPQDIRILVGGEGCPENIEGIEIIRSFDKFYDWLMDNFSNETKDDGTQADGTKNSETL
ncbi:MerR family transcriptional regulator [bacterium]|nr:MerR family transcriptional regulator [bacterium]